MPQIWKKLLAWWQPPQKPQPGPRRVKNYSAQTGFHYQYQLETTAPGDYVFAIWTATRPRFFLRIEVPLPDVTPRDRYALAKLHLFRAFDEHAPLALPLGFLVTSTAALDELQRDGMM